MGKLTVTQNAAGAWDVVDDAGAVLASFPTNAEAWRFVDRHSGEGEHPRLNPIAARLKQKRRKRWRKKW
jgi:hypothetical protein